jgi:tetratricopeptide (TPR) repeat protein
MISEALVLSRYAEFFNEFLQLNSEDHSAVDEVYSHLENVIPWLAAQKDPFNSNMFLAIMDRLVSYCEERSIREPYIQYFQSSLDAAERTSQNPAHVYFNTYRANWALGNWNKAQILLQKAVACNESNGHEEQAQYLRFLGNLQLNQGNYRQSLKTFARAKALFHDLGDQTGENGVKLEEAAYYLNITEYDTAYILYSEIYEYEMSITSQASDQTLLMMGVITRRLKYYSDSRKYLFQLLERAKTNQNRSAFGTASHHLAWTYFHEGVLQPARDYGILALHVYEDIQDPRGISDAYDQLATLEVTIGNFDQALEWFEIAASMRRRLGNHHGYASSLRNLAKLYFRQKNYPKMILNLIKSLYQFAKIGMLSAKRISKFIADYTTPKKSISGE